MWAGTPNTMIPTKNQFPIWNLTLTFNLISTVRVRDTVSVSAPLEVLVRCAGLPA